jgi:hypothetical protein
MLWAPILIMGILSAGVCGVGHLLLQDLEWLLNIFPGLIFGLALWLVGRLIGLSRRDLPTELPLIMLASVAAWRLAVRFGYFEGAWHHFEVAGALGASVLAFALFFIWRIQRFLPWMGLLVLAGALGGALFIAVDLFINQNELLWVFLLFLIWQPLFLLFLPMARKASGVLS